MSTSRPPAAPVVRTIADADVPTAVTALADAFADYPFTRHVIAAADHRERIRRYQELCLTRIGMAHGRVWVADGGSAVAVWGVPGRDPSPAFAELGPILAELSGDRAPAAAAADAAMAPHRPEERGWFLETVATAPDRQGAGLGRAVLAPGIQEAERSGHPAFLETSDASNVGFYRRLGFVVTAEVRLPDDGPRTWCMRRDPGRG
ncbi:GNAT family N-acetyltransferase [Streptomyces bohaiensis]|uniref:GNAT family N-acetyltransferase n=1 Tax=Streptomyces bohaiensis TaxID=1431344 RepID=A0ABX1CIF5_9ACTN|nr:GNAT family N-acetyltransferase [Streptomyces bohaiensis]NJQ17034.1 GNAT family N-acetyltransferase [Streptomyces bohaiensis]